MGRNISTDRVYIMLRDLQKTVEHHEKRIIAIEEAIREIRRGK